MSVENIDRIRRQSETIELTEINQGILNFPEPLTKQMVYTAPDTA